MIFHRRLPRFRYVRPKTVEEAVEILHAGPRAKVLAGGTDLIPRLKRRQEAVPSMLLDVKGIDQLRELKWIDKDTVSIGATVTLRDLEANEDIRRSFPCLAQACSVIGSLQIRNRATLMGNICNAVPSADTAPALLVLDAVVVARSAGGDREIPIGEFFLGPRQTALSADELAVRVVIPAPKEGYRGLYLKHGPRGSMDLAVVGVAVWGLLEDGTFRDVRIGLGAVAPTPIRAKGAEGFLLGRKADEASLEEAAHLAEAECSPIDDHRASAAYRREMVRVLVKRGLKALAGEPVLKEA